MIKTYVFIVLSISSSLISSILNHSAYQKGYMPTPFQALVSVLCVISWILISFYSGYRNDKEYLIFCNRFWGIGSLLFIVGYLTEVLLIILPSILLISGPLYGLRYFFNMKPNLYIYLIPILIAYVLILFGYLMGKKFSDINR